jgi:hypothetical protein
VVFSPDGKYVVSSGTSVLLSDLTRKKSKPVLLYKWDRGLGSDQLAFPADGQTLVIGG